MLENKKVNMIISLIIAIALWAFVIGEVNPEATRSYRDVPIQFLNEEVLTENGMAVYSVSDRSINVMLTGTRSEINKIDTKDITAAVDLGDAAMGENQLQVDVRIAGKAEVESQSIEKVMIVVEEQAFKDVPIEVSYEGAFNGEEEPITIDMELETVRVSGAVTTVEQVVAVAAIVEEGTVAGEPKEIQCNLIPVNQNGQRIYNVELSVNSIFVTSELAKLKTVPLHVSFEGEDTEGIERTVKAPETITIKGMSADLKEIDAIETETIYLDSILSSKTVPVDPILPDGIVVAKESENLTVVVQVTELQTASFEFGKEEIEYRNLPEGLKAEVETGQIKIDVTGSESLLNSLTKEQITLFVDLSDLGEGKHKKDLVAECTLENAAMEISPKKVSVVLKKAETETDMEDKEQETTENNVPQDQQDNQDENRSEE